MCIVEIHEMEIISINKTMTEESKQTKTYVLVVAVKRAVLNGSTKCRFKFFLNFSCEEEFTISFRSF